MPFVSAEQMDSATTAIASITLRECDTSMPQGMGTMKESCHLPPRAPISLSSQHLPHLRPAPLPHSLEILSPRTLRRKKRGGGGAVGVLLQI